ncbi:hypothetical protein J3Q64DRAFT_1816955 [Phycomyces blakesleeanus]|uniref:DUSP domain-containing protein n=2 Tax=Phycomyces blakesleeanus TaxID=4837 RepID=A0A163E8Z9_PHYB8|nr:hypothetical protein PHYBLDRAFT_164324 [Phycomyces blakesleeanus NRRL 1555(-)]OAD77410.1 hypothetical protein PHYBLDRAFT_164324 [Phycomyces blakesleeanus NRRL 1555(-)]|eukprot:XP_018295450.1 hypothetical protein PHYBLDRAFT_164324 [Phycomyces blakesleeanus NRRL 1555(-)]
MPQLLNLNNELLTAIAGHLSIDDLKTFSIVCHKFAMIAHDDSVWREMLYNNFGITYKLPEETWKSMYARKHEDPTNNRMCPHVCRLTRPALEPYVRKYQQVLNWLPKNLNCTTCGQNQHHAGVCMYMWQGNTRLRCRDCAYKFHTTFNDRRGILFRLPRLQLFCFACSRQLGETRGDSSEAHFVHGILKTLTHDSEIGQESLRQKEQCLRERELYATDADRASVLESDPHYYFVDRMWLTTWFLRTCDGDIGKGPIPNHTLAGPDDKLNPDARPRGNFAGGISIVTPYLWKYLVDTYGLSGNVYTSDDIKGPEYCELRQSIADWRLN